MERIFAGPKQSDFHEQESRLSQTLHDLIDRFVSDISYRYSEGAVSAVEFRELTTEEKNEVLSSLKQIGISPWLEQNVDGTWYVGIEYSGDIDTLKELGMFRAGRDTEYTPPPGSPRSKDQYSYPPPPIKREQEHRPVETPERREAEIGSQANGGEEDPLSVDNWIAQAIDRFDQGGPIEPASESQSVHNPRRVDLRIFPRK